MIILYATLETCSAATDTVVVIDVWRSFTTAAFAFDAGARDIIAVASAEEALALRERFPGSLLMGMGELGRPPAGGFDFGNSPAALMARNLHDQRFMKSSARKPRRKRRGGRAACLRRTASLADVDR